tara:strand:- start:78 stop:362 length:285 start_codon:yes stop_codon:yes gene_type:complete
MLLIFPFTLKGRNKIVPIINEKNKIKKPTPKFFGNSKSNDNRYLRDIPPIKPPILLNAKPNPKKRPLCDPSVVWFKKSVHIGTMIPIEKAYRIK